MHFLRSQIFDDFISQIKFFFLVTLNQKEDRASRPYLSCLIYKNEEFLVFMEFILFLAE